MATTSAAQPTGPARVTRSNALANNGPNGLAGRDQEEADRRHEQQLRTYQNPRYDNTHNPVLNAMRSNDPPPTSQDFHPSAGASSGNDATMQNDGSGENIVITPEERVAQDRLHELGAANRANADPSFPEDVARIFAPVLQKISGGWNQGTGYWNDEVLPLVRNANRQVIERNQRMGITRPESHYQFPDGTIQAFQINQDKNILAAARAQRENDLPRFQEHAKYFIDQVEFFVRQTMDWGFPLKSLMNDETYQQVSQICGAYTRYCPHDAQSAARCMRSIDYAVAIGRKEARTISSAIEDVVKTSDPQVLTTAIQRVKGITNNIRLKQIAYQLPTLDGLETAIESIGRCEFWCRADAGEGGKRTLLVGLQQALSDIPNLQIPSLQLNTSVQESGFEELAPSPESGTPAQGLLQSPPEQPQRQALPQPTPVGPMPMPASTYTGAPAHGPLQSSTAPLQRQAFPQSTPASLPQNTVQPAQSSTVHQGRLNHTTVAPPLSGEAIGAATNHGWLVGVKPAGRTSCRVIVNCGTDEIAHFNVLPGSYFGRGRCEKLLNSSKLTHQSLEGKTEDDMTVTDCCQVATDFAEPTRKPPTFFRVVWNESQTVDWLTFTELCKVAGKKYATENYYNVLTLKWLQNQACFELARNREVHPCQQQPLTQEQRERMPWLCPPPKQENLVLKRGTRIRSQHVQGLLPGAQLPPHNLELQGMRGASNYYPQDPNYDSSTVDQPPHPIQLLAQRGPVPQPQMAPGYSQQLFNQQQYGQYGPAPGTTSQSDVHLQSQGASPQAQSGRPASQMSGVFYQQ